MKRAKPYRFDPFAAMSCHDLTQEARRLRRANRKLRNEIRRRADEEDDSDTFVLENAPANRSQNFTSIFSCKIGSSNSCTKRNSI